jgi:hypothetical protein
MPLVTIDGTAYHQHSTAFHSPGEGQGSLVDVAGTTAISKGNPDTWEELTDG